MKKKPKAAVGDRYDVILTDGGDQKIEVARIVKKISGQHRVGAELTELFDCPTPIIEMRHRRRGGADQAWDRESPRLGEDHAHERLMAVRSRHMRADGSLCRPGHFSHRRDGLEAWADHL
jgi:hypothetical protein